MYCLSHTPTTLLLPYILIQAGKLENEKLSTMALSVAKEQVNTLMYIYVCVYMWMQAHEYAPVHNYINTHVYTYMHRCTEAAQAVHKCTYKYTWHLQ